MLSALHHFFAPMPGHGPAYFGKLAGGFVFMLAVLAALQLAPRRSRRGIIAFFTFLGGPILCRRVLLACSRTAQTR